ncbi:hypothetical protein D9758_008397 [Tetrapyrgos nigripes]|uniref:Uncharacterized protein n=1 Tax=Tetrapyrgos nigripes TaxID=182062 RepID=A0A8H5GDZ1_9AGAR|nr:hypothetical protein D9758_008397 [Tetrapyrgos nigripes]
MSTNSASSWKALFSNVLHASHDPQEAGTKLASFLTSSTEDRTHLESVAIHLLNLAIETPAAIDTLLGVYTSMAESLPDDFEEGSWKGKNAARKALGIQLSECTQSLNPVLQPIFVDLLDDTCKDIPKDSNPNDVAEAVRQMARNRRTYIIATAVYGRARTVDAVMEDDPQYDMAIYRIENSLGLNSDSVYQVEANHVAAALYILSCGDSLAGHWEASKRKATIEKIIGALRERIVTEESFKLKVLFSNALVTLQSGGKGWTSEEMFSDKSSLWLF